MPKWWMMQRYNQKEHEWYFVHLYNVLLTTGDLAAIFLEPQRNLTSFLALFADANCVCFFDLDMKGVCFAGWFRPIGNAVEFTLWVRKDARQRPKMLKNLEELLDNALKLSPVIVSITAQSRLEEMALKLGYHKVGVIPHLIGVDAHIYAMTRESRADVKVLRYSRVRQLVKGQNLGMLQ